MGRYIVLDIVFYGRSLNYDQGIGNYQELKKITKWDGRQYTLVSRYALRYSILETAKRIVNWQIAEGNILTTETKKVTTETKKEGGETDAETGEKRGAIQPSSEALLSGEILLYPEFDLFGYLVTSTEPQNFRAAPVKISHAISMTPFNYDALFNANIGLANRLRKTYGELKPNPFPVEEHETYYIYSIVIDVDNIGKRVEVYYKIKNNEDKKILDSANKKYKEEIEDIIDRDLQDINIEDLKPNDLISFTYTLRKENKEGIHSVKGRVEGLIKTILNLKRSIKGREEDLSPKLLVVGIYNNSPYKTYKDKIVLVDESTEEEYSEIEERNENGKRIVCVKYKKQKGRKPLFRIEDGKELPIEKINEEDVIEFVDKLLDEESDGQQQENTKNRLMSEVKVFYDPTIKVETPEECRK